MKSMYKNLNLLLSVSSLLFLFSCSDSITDFDSYQDNPNETTQAEPGLILTNLEISAFNSIDLEAAYASRYLVDINVPQDAQYYLWNRGGYTYSQLRQCLKMREESLRLNNETMVAVADLMQIYIFHQMTRRFGDIPYEEALMAEEGIDQPEYTPQSAIYEDLLSQLEEVNTVLSQLTDTTVNGDVVFGGDVLRWQKFANSLRIRILISLSEKLGGSINIEEQFRTIIANPSQYPIMESNADNCAYTYNNGTDNNYPFFNQASFSSRYLEETLVDLLKERNDPRLFRIAAPSVELPTSADEENFSLHSGLIASNSLDQNSVLLSQRIGSPIDARYRNNPEAEPNLALGYAEVMFSIAEAAQRGWISEDPEIYYQEGIRASMQFYAVDEEIINSYLSQEDVVYDSEDGLEMILNQKYMSMFLNSGWEAFFNQRRTGIPEFDVSQGQILNDGMVPKRWMYPQNELNTNRDNLVKALERQFDGEDTVNQEIWLIN